ncbi:hypothetical protein GUJ93_ZPchr0005g15929 [Zizania palustris]|uniref:Uncharacterized protein n=1 Tax=Zizania palustris TaxID=103762 RepID=A0A8J5T3P2_ZIZPA|nr:hypothetical protein GUJ93_ZPchr0005g15929 [Zizania palustris]
MANGEAARAAAEPLPPGLRRRVAEGALHVPSLPCRGGGRDAGRRVTHREGAGEQRVTPSPAARDLEAQ